MGGKDRRGRFSAGGISVGPSISLPLWEIPDFANACRLALLLAVIMKNSSI